jgi:alpha-beta hydrolase superfamily lysophospholipase
VHGVEGHRTNARGQKLFIVTYCATSDQRAVLFHHHGYGEHVGRMRRCKLVRRNVTNIMSMWTCCLQSHHLIEQASSSMLQA